METVSARPPAAPRMPVPPVTEAYQKAHKNYILSSALLASWQLLGITLDTEEKWGISLKSPSAVPLILIVLVIYFGYKITIVWFQCDPHRRTNVAAAIDYRVAHTIGAAALTITFVQYLLSKQLIDIILHHASVVELLLGLSTYAGATVLAAIWYRHKRGLPIRQKNALLVGILALSLFIPSAILTVRTSGFVTAVATSFVAMLFALFIARAAQKELEALERRNPDVETSQDGVK